MRSGTLIRAAHNEPWPRVGLALVGLKARATRNRFVLTRRRNPVKTLLQFGVVMPAIAGLIALLTVGFASALNDVTDDGLSTTILASIIAVYLLGSFVGSSTTALQALYLADDIPFLLALPIPLRAMFASKFVEASLGALPAGILFVAAALGYGAVNAERPAYWALCVVIAFGVAATATAVSVTTVSLITRFVPPRRARLFLFAVSVLLIGATAMLWRWLAPKPQMLGDMVNRSEYDPLWNVLSWTPVGWSAQAMTQAATGSVARAVILTAFLVASAVISIVISYSIFRRTFLRGLAQTRAVQAAQPNESVARWVRAAALPMPRRLGSVVVKEWLVLFRDLRRLTGAIWPVGIVLVYTVVLGRGSTTTFGSDDLAFWSRNGSLALLPWGLSLGISVYSIGSEGRNVHLLRTLPMPASHIFLAKVLASLLPVAILSLSAAALSLWIRDAPLLPAIELLGLIIWMVIGYVVIDTAAAATCPNFDTDQVQRTIGLTGRFFSFALGSLFGIATIVAAGRLILMATKPPESVAELLTIDANGIELFGWPLVIAAGVVAVLVIAFAVSIAIRETNRLIHLGA